MNVVVPGLHTMMDSPITSSPCITRVDIEPRDTELIAMHRQVVGTTSRIELATGDGQTSVLISKHELDALEQALAILSDTESVKSMREQLLRIAALSRNPVVG